MAPFDSAAGLADETGLRLARNTQLILQEETKLSSVIDPAGGSWYIEELTDQVAMSSWKIFQEVERLGGIENALLSGQLQASIANTREKRRQDLAVRSTPLTGTSEFPDLDEDELLRGFSSNQCTSRRIQMRTLPSFRWSIPFEQMREAARLSSTTGLVSGESWRCRDSHCSVHRRKEPF